MRFTTSIQYMLSTETIMEWNWHFTGGTSNEESIKLDHFT